MGTWTYAIVEYRGSTGANFDAQEWGSINFRKYNRLVCGKDYDFLELFFGSKQRQSPFPLRGIPVDASPQGLDELSRIDSNQITWLNYSELTQVMKIYGSEFANFSLAAQVVLRVMQFLAGRLGPDRVRVLVGAD